MATPEFDGDSMNGDAWSIVVNAFDGGVDDGTMFISNPSFTDNAQFFIDGSVVLGRQREMSLKRLASPTGFCTPLDEGTFYWDEQANALCVCDGSTWKPLDADETGTCA